MGQGMGPIITCFMSYINHHAVYPWWIYYKGTLIYYKGTSKDKEINDNNNKKRTKMEMKQCLTLQKGGKCWLI